jgi:hypothetical protein
VCFGREPVKYVPKFRHEHRKSIRYL